MASKPPLYNITIRQNTTCSIRFKWRTSGENSQPINLTNATAVLQVRTETKADHILFEASTQNGLLKIYPNDGIVHLYFHPGLQSTKLNFKEGKYDLLVRLPSTNDVHCICEGDFVVKTGVSKL